MAKQKNSFWSYFLEILVVIIGISAAFTLDRWASANKENELERNYKSSLVADLNKDIEDLQLVIDSTNTILRNVGEVFQYNYDNAPVGSYKRRHVVSTYLASYFYPQNGTYVSLINSGDIAVMKDFDLKTALSDHYNIKYKEIERIDQVIKNLVDNMIQPYMIENIEFLITADGIGSAAPLKTNHATNMMGSMFNLMSARQQAYQDLKSACEELLKDLNEDKE